MSERAVTAQRQASGRAAPIMGGIAVLALVIRLTRHDHRGDDRDDEPTAAGAAGARVDA